MKGEERQAELVASAAWCGGDARRVRGFAAVTSHGLGPEEAAAVAARWWDIALMEHASIAAFARFTLQLLQLGAPPELVEAAQLAMADETRHARICFGLAERYSGQAMGPGPLSLAQALDASDLRSCVLTAVLEGCVGETVASVEAAEAAEHCDNQELRTTLRSIAGDERRHAELSWRFLAWALERAPVSLIDELEVLFRRSIRYPAAVSVADQTSPTERTLLRHGHLPEAHRQRLRQQVLAEVVKPVAAALLSKLQNRQVTCGLENSSSFEDSQSL